MWPIGFAGGNEVSGLTPDAHRWCATEREMTDGERIERPPLPAIGSVAARRPRRSSPVLHLAARPPVRPRGRRRAATRSSSPTRPGARSTTTRRTRCWSATPGRATATSPARSVPATPPRAGGRAWSARDCRSTPSGTSSCAPTCSAAARDRPGRLRSSRRPAGRTDRASRSSRSATWSAPRPRCEPPRHREVAQRHRRLDGRHAGARVGRHVPDRRALARCRSPRARRPPPSRSRSAASAVERSGSTRSGGAATTTTPRPAKARTRGSRSPGSSRRSRSVRRRLHRPVRSRDGRRAGRLRACGSASRSSATSTTTATSSSAASTRTATSSSARRWTSTTSGADAGGWRRRWRASACRRPHDRHPLRHALPELPAEQIRDVLQSTGGRAEYVEIDSAHGHDAFLIDLDQVGEAVDGFLDDVKKEHWDQP